MIKPIFTDLAPNTEKDDVVLAWRQLLSPGLWRQGSAIGELEAFMGKYLPVKHAVTFESGRTGLMALLKALDLPSGSEILVQAFTCVAVPDAVLWAGCRPIFVDCSDATYNIDPERIGSKISDKTRAIIVQHTFGCMADMPAIIQIAKQHNLLVIEDCAHAIGSAYRGQKAGTWGDVAVFSFGRDKAASSVFGGLIATNRDDVAQRLRQAQETYPFPSGTWVMRQLLHPVIMSFAKKTYATFGLGKILLAIIRKSGLLSKAVEQQERKGERASFIGHKMPNALAVLALHQMKKVDGFNAHRRKIAKEYAKLLSNSSVGLPDERQNHLDTYIRYTIRHAQAAEVRTQAKRQLIYLGAWYDTPVAPRGVDYTAVGYRLGAYPVAEELARTVINLPTDIHISEVDVMRIAKVIKDV